MEILMQRGARKKLIEDFKVSKPTLIAALNGSSETKLSKILVLSAIERGGVLTGTSPAWFIEYLERKNKTNNMSSS